jgi:hypothetical protein
LVKINKILKFFDVDPVWRQFGSGMEKSRIRDKHPGSATLVEMNRKSFEVFIMKAAVW